MEDVAAAVAGRVIRDPSGADRFDDADRVPVLPFHVSVYVQIRRGMGLTIQVMMLSRGFGLI